MNDSNGKKEQGRFEGMVLEALDNIKKDIGDMQMRDRNEHQRLYDKIHSSTGDCSEQINELRKQIGGVEKKYRATAATVSGIVTSVGMAIQGAFLWWNR
jgi:conjugal transfer/entry exclusion protein